jgi:hypothetical protein
MQYSSYRPKASTPKLNKRESNAELTPSWSDRFSSLRTQNWSPKTNPQKKKGAKKKKRKERPATRARVFGE